MNQGQTPIEFQGRLTKGKDWRDLVAWIGDLPPMPAVASRALLLLDDPDVACEKLTSLIATDTALAARILKISNSAMFCRQQEISTLREAVVVIGFKSLKGIIAAATIRQVYNQMTPLRAMVWDHSVCTAMCARALALKLKKSFVEEAYLIGLLHSLGQIILMNHEDTSADYSRVLEEIEASPCTYTIVEEEIFGFSHPLIGALVAKKWHFSPDTCRAILHYQDLIESAPERPQDQKTAIVQLADLLVHELEIGSPARYPRSKAEVERLALLLGFEKRTVNAKLEELLLAVGQQFHNERSLFD